MLQCVKRYVLEHGYAPSIRELGNLCGIKSLRGVTTHLDALERKGRLLRVPGIPRALRVIEPPLPAIAWLNGGDDWNQWHVASETDPRRSYLVTINSDGSCDCSCPAFRYHRLDQEEATILNACKHVRMVVDHAVDGH